MPASAPEMRWSLPIDPALLQLVDLDDRRQELEVVAGVAGELLEGGDIFGKTVVGDDSACRREGVRVGNLERVDGSGNRRRLASTTRTQAGPSPKVRYPVGAMRLCWRARLASTPGRSRSGTRPSARSIWSAPLIRIQWVSFVDLATRPTRREVTIPRSPSRRITPSANSSLMVPNSRIDARATIHQRPRAVALPKSATTAPTCPRRSDPRAGRAGAGRSCCARGRGRGATRPRAVATKRSPEWQLQSR